MTPDETADLLRYAATLDRWLRATDAEHGQMMVTGWTDMLAAVPADVAEAAVQRHYSEPGVRTIQPGDVLGFWREYRAELSRDRGEPERPTIQDPLDVPLPAGGGAYLRRCLEVAAEGGRIEDVPTPNSYQRSPSAEARERECAYPSICACSHTECRGGFLDAEETVRSVLGQRYPAVRRCPVCVDGLVMAVEQGVARKPSRVGRR